MKATEKRAQSGHPTATTSPGLEPCRPSIKPRLWSRKEFSGTILKLAGELRLRKEMERQRPVYVRRRSQFDCCATNGVAGRHIDDDLLGWESRSYPKLMAEQIGIAAEDDRLITNVLI
jgi:hypothetical protein